MYEDIFEIFFSLFFFFLMKTYIPEEDRRRKGRGKNYSEAQLISIQKF